MYQITEYVPTVIEFLQLIVFIYIAMNSRNIIDKTKYLTKSDSIRIIFDNKHFNRRELLNDEEMSSLLRGKSIYSTIKGIDTTRIVFTDGFSLEISDSSMSLSSPFEEEERAVLSFQIITGRGMPTVREVESALRAVRQIYNISLLSEQDRELIPSIEHASVEQDFEQFVERQDRLFIDSATPGSFWVTLIAKSRAGAATLRGMIPLFYNEGRNALIERTRIETDRRRLELSEKEFDFFMKRANKVVDLSNKIERIKDDTTKDMFRKSFRESLRTLEIPLSRDD